MKKQSFGSRVALWRKEKGMTRSEERRVGKECL